MDQIKAHGGKLCDLVLARSLAINLRADAVKFPVATLTKRQMCDLELLMNGAYSPLEGFMNQNEYDSVLGDMRLLNGLLWPIPIVFDVPVSFIEEKNIAVGSKVALEDEEGFMLAVLSVGSIWVPDKDREALDVYGTTSSSHPGVNFLKNESGAVYLGGSIEGFQLPESYVFNKYRRTPREQRAVFLKRGWGKVIAYPTSKIIHRLQKEVLTALLRKEQAHLLIHPVVESTNPEDTHHYTRIHCYQAVLKYFPEQTTMLSIMPLFMRMAGARENLWRGIIHQNYGCTHFVVEPDKPLFLKNNKEKNSFDSQRLIKSNEDYLDIKMISLEDYQYSPSNDCFLPISEILSENSGDKGVHFCEKNARDALLLGESLPAWFSYPEVIHEMKKVYLPKSKQGYTIFFTGLSGSGKSTIAKIVNARLIEDGSRSVTLLDGDVVRLNLSSELGFSKKHRNLNIRRIGFVANEITKNKGIAICAPIAPYAKSRREVRSLIEEHGSFIEVHVSTPLSVCEERDRKGLYAKARKGIIPEFTGVSDPYDLPEAPELKIDTSLMTPLEAGQIVLLYLFQEGFLGEKRWS